MIRKIFSAVLFLSLLLTLPLTAHAATKAEIEPYAQKLIQYYRYYQDDAEDVIWDILQQMAAVDPDQAAVWERIMEHWSWVNSGMPVAENVLPDGLPEDNSLCIVVLGYGLNDDGSMKEELVDRLVVALASAVKYPNAWIAVTGGQTSETKGVTEAGQMAAWLQKKGIEQSRIIQEKQSLSTTANAVNTYKLLSASYPQVNSIALISSDYHLSWSSAMFTAVSDYKFGYEGGSPLELVGGAVCDTGSTADTLVQQAWGISAITGISFDENAAAPALYAVERPTEPETEPTEAPAAGQDRAQVPALTPEPAQEETQEETEKGTNYILPILAVLLLAAVYILTPKKPRKKRKKPEWKWE